MIQMPSGSGRLTLASADTGLLVYLCGYQQQWLLCTGHMKGAWHVTDGKEFFLVEQDLLMFVCGAQLE